MDQMVVEGLLRGHAEQQEARAPARTAGALPDQVYLHFPGDLHTCAETDTVATRFAHGPARLGEPDGTGGRHADDRR